MNTKGFYECWNSKSKLIYGNDLSKEPFFTIMIPTYRRVELLRQTIESVLNQVNFTDYEILVCDNEPTRNDLTEQYILSLSNEKIRYYKNSENIGIYGNMIKIVQYSRGKWLILLDDDDLMSPYYLHVLYEYIARNNFYGMIGCQSYNIYGEKKFEFPHLPSNISFSEISVNEFFFGNRLSSPGQAMPRRMFLKMIREMKNGPLMGDQKMQYCALHKYKLVKINIQLTAYRITSNNATKSEQILSGLFDGMFKFLQEIADDTFLLRLFKRYFFKEYMYLYIDGGINSWKSKLKMKSIMNKYFGNYVEISKRKILITHKMVSWIRKYYTIIHQLADKKVEIVNGE